MLKSDVCSLHSVAPTGYSDTSSDRAKHYICVIMISCEYTNDGGGGGEDEDKDEHHGDDEDKRDVT